MAAIKITVHGRPLAQKRPKFFSRKMKSGRVFAGAYNPQETEAGRFSMLAMAQLPDGFKILTRPVSIKIIFYMGRPRNHFGTGKNSNLLKKTAPIIHSSKPDIDNLQKMVYDCLNRVVWVDDSCVFESFSRKEYSDNPRTEITIKEVV